jgi:hypothetical protein
MKKFDKRELAIESAESTELKAAKDIIESLAAANGRLAAQAAQAGGAELQGYKKGFRAALETVKTVLETELKRLAA